MVAAARDHGAGHFAVAEDLVVVVAFGAAVVEPAHGRVAPVDDAHAGLGVEVGAPADQHLATAGALFEHQAPKVGRRVVDRGFFDRAQASREGLQPLHLLDERGHVFHARGGDLIAEIEQALVVSASRGAWGAYPRLREVFEHTAQAGFFLAHDASELLVSGDGVGSGRALELHEGGRIAYHEF